MLIIYQNQITEFKCTLLNYCVFYVRNALPSCDIISTLSSSHVLTQLSWINCVGFFEISTEIHLYCEIRSPGES